MNKKEGVLLMNMFIKEELDDKKYLFKDVETGTLFKIDNELYLKVSNERAFSIDYCVLEDIEPESIIDYIITEGSLTITNISYFKEGV